MNRHQVSVKAMAIATVLLFAAAGQYAFADNVQNDVVANVGGAKVETITEGGSTLVNFRIAANNGDGENGCNAVSGSPAMVSINAPSGVSANPSSLQFTSCGTDQSVEFSSSAVGDHDITVSVSDSGPGTYNTNPAKFTLRVIEGEPPVVVDSTAPSITYTVNGVYPPAPDGDNGWYTSDAFVDWTVTDGESTIASITGCVDTMIDFDTAGTTLDCSATSEGGTAGPVSVTIMRDATAPSITGTATPAANTNGWNNEDVAVDFDCSDSTSGIASCEGDTILTDETDSTGVTITGTAIDNAGNTNTNDVGPIRIDKTAPTNIEFTDGEIVNDGVYYYGLVPEGPTQCTAEDLLSGVDHCSVDSTNAGTSVGGHSYVATAVDNADNSDSITLSYTVNHWTLTGFYSPVKMSPDAPSQIVWNTLKGGQTVPLKFEIFAGDTEFTTTTFDGMAIGTFKTQKISCSVDPSPVEDSLDLSTTGGTSFRYDESAGQYIQNWQTPKQSNVCYSATFTAQDGSNLTAYFKLK